MKPQSNSRTVSRSVLFVSDEYASLARLFRALNTELSSRRTTARTPPTVTLSSQGNHLSSVHACWFFDNRSNNRSAGYGRTLAAT